MILFFFFNLEKFIPIILPAHFTSAHYTEAIASFVLIRINMDLKLYHSISFDTRCEKLHGSITIRKSESLK